MGTWARVDSGAGGTPAIRIRDPSSGPVVSEGIDPSREDRELAFEIRALFALRAYGLEQDLYGVGEVGVIGELRIREVARERGFVLDGHGRVVH